MEQCHDTVNAYQKRPICSSQIKLKILQTYPLSWRGYSSTLSSCITQISSFSLLINCKNYLNLFCEMFVNFIVGYRII